MLNKIKKLVKENKDYMIKIRRELHMYPETEFEEFKTAGIIKRELDSMNVPYQDKIALTGIKAVIEGKKSGGCVLLRADIDALPIMELNDVEYKSTNIGKMHACGHDAHTAIALGVCKALNEIKDELEGKVIIIFQPAEEGVKGARAMVEKVDFAFAVHMEADFVTGSVAFKVGGMMASPDEFDLTITGKGGHGAYRYRCTDPIYAASKITSELIEFAQSKHTHKDPCVISIGQISGGTFYNIIPDSVAIKGTARAVNVKMRQALCEGVKEITQRVSNELGVKAELDFRFLFPPLENSENAIKIMEKVAIDNGFDIVWLEKPFMGGDDFSYFSQLTDGAYINIGCRNEEKDCVYSLHNARFNIDEDSLEVGAVMLGCATYEALKKKNGEK